MEKALLIAMLSVFSLALRAQTATDLLQPNGVDIKVIANNPSTSNWWRAPEYVFQDYEAATSDRYFSSNEASHAWVGLDLGTPHVITGVSWFNRTGHYGMSYQLGWDGYWHYQNNPYSCMAVFEGANEEDFSDAVPLYLITETSEVSQWREAAVNVSKGFRYVRYVGPNSSYGRICKLKFFGYEGEGDDTQYYQPTNLPVVVVHTKETTNNAGIWPAGTDPREEHGVNPSDFEMLASFSFISQEGCKRELVSGSFRERGNSSRHFGKRPYRVKLDSKKSPFSSKAKAKKWALVPAIDDKTLMRNLIGYKISEGLGMEYTPYCRPVDVFVNGEFKGQYQFCDQVEVDGDRVNVEKIKEVKNAAGNVIGWPDDVDSFGWLTEIDAQVDVESARQYETAGSYFWATKPWESIPVTIKAPDADDTGTKYTENIRKYFEAAFTATRDGNVAEKFDLPSLARYFLGIEFVGNTDGYRSIYMYKHAGDPHIFTGPMWDLNLTLNNDYRIGDLNKCLTWSVNEQLKRGDEHWVNAGKVKQFLNALLNDNPAFLKEVKDVWASVRQTQSLTTEGLQAEVEALETKLNVSQAINYQRWQILNRAFFYEPSAPGSWAAEVNILKDALAGRVDWMDNQVWKGSPKTASKQITITDARWATIYLPHAFAVPEGLTCYAVTGVDDAEGDVQKLKLKAVTNTEANKPYLLYGEPGTYTLAGYAGGYIDDTSRGERSLGLLTGVAVQRAATVGTYVLQNHNGRVCFYRVYEDSHSTVKPERAYLTLPATASNAPVRFYLDDEENALDEIAQTEDNVQIFNLSGKLLNEVQENKVSETLRQYGRGIYVIRSGSESHKVTIRE